MDKEIAIQAALTRQLFSASKIALVTSIILATILAYTQSGVIGSGVVLAWYIMAVLVALLHAALVIAYQRSDIGDDSATHSWLIRLRLGIFVLAMVWGSACILLFPANNPLHQIFLVFILAGFTAGGVISYSADLVSGIVFIVSVILPLIVRMLIAEDRLSVEMSMAITLYLVFLIVSLRFVNRNVSENVALHIETAEREKMARISEQRYRLLLNHSPAGIMHYDNGLNITYCNDCFADILCSSAERLTGLDMNTLKDQSVFPALKKALEGELGYYEGYYLATYSDTSIWAAVTCAPSLDSDGKIVGGVAIVQDVTARKQAEAHIRELNAELEQRVRERTAQLETTNRELRESEQRYREIFENVTDALYLIELTPENQFRNLAFNRAFEKSTGIPRHELIGTIAERVQEEGNAMTREVARGMVARYRSCIEAGKPVETDSVFDLPSGRRYYQSTLVPLRDDAGEIRRILGVARDITEIKRVERKFRTLAENIPDSIIRYDRNARQIYVNTAAERTLGVSAHALHSMTTEEPPENIYATKMDGYLCRVRWVLETGEPQELEAALWHAEKGLQVHNLRFVAERDERGEIVGALMVGHNITELKAIENELKASREQLRGLMARREEAREEERKHIAREVHDELGQILTGLKLSVSVLNHRLGAGQELATGKLQETMLLTDRALDVARNVASALRPSALEMGIASALEWLLGRFGANTGIRCDLHIDDDDIQLNEVSAIALFRIVQESLTNISRHAQADHVDVTLRREADDYVMKVEDNGSGFDALLKKTNSFGLVGIRERALMLGGTVDIDSQPGKGTEIVVRIPVQTTVEES